ncbi:MAG: hypothetical protein GXO82_10560 [Chlorobi bacterium]|nr:hypothetical protein [Chlorobiota bacterium]
MKNVARMNSANCSATLRRAPDEGMVLTSTGVPAFFPVNFLYQSYGSNIFVRYTGTSPGISFRRDSSRAG